MTFRKILRAAGLVVFFAGALFVIYSGVNMFGQLLRPRIQAHETEHAHCYTAGKMFFVSIACVPKM